METTLTADLLDIIKNSVGKHVGISVITPVGLTIGQELKILKIDAEYEKIIIITDEEGNANNNVWIPIASIDRIVEEDEEDIDYNLEHEYHIDYEDGTALMILVYAD